jgi:hypothetical protein
MPDLPIAIQTLYADLVEKAWTGDTARLLEGVPGSAYLRQTPSGSYWYWQPPTEQGGRRSATYLGKDTPALRKRIAEMRGSRAPSLRERRELVRALRSSRLPAPDRLTGEIAAALAQAGVFRLRAVLVGSVAFQCYPGLLGTRLPAPLSRTGDLDVAQFHSIAVAVEDAVEGDLLGLLKQVDGRFDAVADPMDTRRTLRYALRDEGQEIYAVDILSPMRGRERGRVTYLRAIRSNAQIVRFLDFLLYQEQNAVMLHGPGVPVNVPAPERYALHKLLVSQMRLAVPRSQVKAAKDIAQGEALIGILREQRPGDLIDAWEEMLDRGPSWRRKAAQAIRRLSPECAGWLLDNTPARHLADFGSGSARGPAPDPGSVAAGRSR